MTYQSEYVPNASSLEELQEIEEDDREKRAKEDELSIDQQKSSRFKKAVFFCILGAVTLPIIFNILSLVNLYRYLQLPASSARKVVFTVVLGALNLIGPFIVYRIWM
jgi:hypothetical protein